MATALDVRAEDRYVTVDGLNIRYLEQGNGPPALLLHGASLGSSADVFLRNLGPLAKGGMRAIAYDQPGFGLSDAPRDFGVPYRRDFMLKFMDALELEKAALVGHSQAGAMSVTIALEHPDRISAVMVMAGGTVLPPLPDGAATKPAAAPAEGREGTPAEPTIEDTRGLLEANLYHHELITPDELELRHSRSLGRNFESSLERAKVQGGGRGGGPPIWQRLGELAMPLVLLYGEQDRGNAAERARLLQQQQPGLDLHVVDGCKHMAPWDAAETFHRLAIRLITGG
jgi:pimeloyl-ACP methyl ester carboxylesterase